MIYGMITTVISNDFDFDFEIFFGELGNIPFYYLFDVPVPHDLNLLFTPMHISHLSIHLLQFSVQKSETKVNE
jgi:hypothetical protein